MPQPSGRPVGVRSPGEAPARRALSPAVAVLLTERGNDAEAVTSRDDLADYTPDSMLMEIAHAEARVMVTSNVKDFRPIAAARLATGEGHPGVIFESGRTPGTRAATRGLADAIERVIEENPDGLGGTERWT